MSVLYDSAMSYYGLELLSHPHRCFIINRIINHCSLTVALRKWWGQKKKENIVNQVQKRLVYTHIDLLYRMTVTSGYIGYEMQFPVNRLPASNFQGTIIMINKSTGSKQSFQGTIVVIEVLIYWFERHFSIGRKSSFLGYYRYDQFIDLCVNTKWANSFNELPCSSNYWSIDFCSIY